MVAEGGVLGEVGGGAGAVGLGSPCRAAPGTRARRMRAGGEGERSSEVEPEKVLY